MWLARSECVSLRLPTTRHAHWRIRHFATTDSSLLLICDSVPLFARDKGQNCKTLQQKFNAKPVPFSQVDEVNARWLVAAEVLAGAEDECAVIGPEGPILKEKQPSAVEMHTIGEEDDNDTTEDTSAPMQKSDTTEPLIP